MSCISIEIEFHLCQVKPHRSRINKDIPEGINTLNLGSTLWYFRWHHIGTSLEKKIFNPDN